MIKCGFFNAINKDRLYTAEDMNNIYAPIISDGIYRQAYVDNSFKVSAAELKVKVAAGKGKFFDHYVENTEELSIDETYSADGLHRIDSVIIKVDISEGVRSATIEIIKGEEISTTYLANAPDLLQTTMMREYRLANLEVTSSSITVSEDTRGSAECPYVHNLLWDNPSTVTIKSRSFTTSENIENYTFNIGLDYTSSDYVIIYKNGMKLIEGIDYTITDDTVTLSYEIVNNNTFEVIVIRNIIKE